MKRVIFAVVLLSLAAPPTAQAQWLERSFWLPDSFPYLYEVDMAYANPVTGRVYIGGGDATYLNILDPASTTKTGFYRAPSVSTACHLYNEHRIVFAADGDDEVWAFDDRADTLVGIWNSPIRGYGMIAYSATQGRFYRGGSGDALWAFDAATGNLLDSVQLTRTPKLIVWDEVHDRLFAGRPGWNELIAAIDCHSHTLLSCIPGTERMVDMALHPTRHELYSLVTQQSQERCVVLLIDTDSLAVVDSIVLPLRGEWGEGGRLALDPARARLYALYAYPWGDRLDREQDTVAVIDIAADSLLRLLTLPEGCWTAGFALDSTDGLLYLAADVPLLLALADSIVVTLPVPMDPVSVAWAGRSNRLVVANDDDTIAIVGGEPDSVLAILDYFGMPIDTLAWDPAGRLYIGSRGGMGWVDETGTFGHWSTRPGRWFAHVPELRRFYHLGYSGGSHTIRVYDCAVDSVVKETPLPISIMFEELSTLAVPSAHRLYITSGWCDTAYVYDLYRDSVVAVRAGFGEEFRYNPRSDRVYGYMYDDPDIAVIDPHTDSLTERIPVSSVRDLAVNAADNELWVLRPDSMLLVYDCAAGRFTDSLRLPEQAGAAFWTAGCNKLYCLYTPEPWMPVTALAIDCRNRRLVSTVDLGIGMFIRRRVIYNDRNDKLYLPGHAVGDARQLAVLHCRTDSVVRLAAGGGLAWDPTANRVFAGVGKQVVVIRDDPYAVEEQPGTPGDVAGAATVVRNVLNLQPAISNQQSAMVLLDITGRRVLELRPGPNDISHLSPGVYFVRQTDGQGSKLSKVVVTH